jgi:hypothetical protein
MWLDMNIELQTIANNWIIIISKQAAYKEKKIFLFSLHFDFEIFMNI